jgi:hypothetical protein
MIAFTAYLLTIPAANWMIGNVGTCIPQGPCLIPVGFGLMAPSGVLMIGLALVLRDIVQRQSGPWVALAAIAIGGVASWFVAPPSLVIASLVAYLAAELLDFAIFTPLQKRGLILAVVASSVPAAFVDSGLFLWLAFGSFDHMAGQVVGKLEMVALAAVVLWAMRRRVEA